MCLHDRNQRLLGDIIVGAGSKPALISKNGRVCIGQNGRVWNPPLQNMSEYGTIVQNTWNDLLKHISGIVLDEFIIMPNHVHGIIQIVDTGLHWAKRAGLEPAPTEIAGTKPAALPEIVRQLKTFSSKRINSVRNSPGKPVWQRNYYEHIIRNEKSLFCIRKYIRENPINWAFDSENHIDREIRQFEMVERGKP
jgi:putative transposase